jgi:hypothetical protein
LIPKQKIQKGRCAKSKWVLVDNSGKRTNFYEAYNHPEPDARVKWRIHICKEFEDMKNKGVWEMFPKEKLQEGRKCVKRNDYSRLRRMETSGKDWWRVDTAKCPV